MVTPALGVGTTRVGSKAELVEPGPVAQCLCVVSASLAPVLLQEGKESGFPVGVSTVPTPGSAAPARSCGVRAHQAGLCQELRD